MVTYIYIAVRVYGGTFIIRLGFDQPATKLVSCAVKRKEIYDRIPRKGTKKWKLKMLADSVLVILMSYEKFCELSGQKFFN